jgi:hypothetical protein
LVIFLHIKNQSHAIYQLWGWEVRPKGVKVGRKTLDIKIKDKNPSIKSIRQMKAQIKKTQIKNKSK